VSRDRGVSVEMTSNGLVSHEDTEGPGKIVPCGRD
jgi:hypothetical protein